MNSFVYVCCQVGAEKALKQNLAAHHPMLTFAFSRPGFVTFKVDGELDLTQPLLSPFARTFGTSVGSIKHTEESSHEENLQRVLEMLPQQKFQHLHVWSRDSHVPGDRGYEPVHREESLELGKQLKAASAANSDDRLEKAPINRTARSGDAVADLIVVDPNHWFVGWHPAQAIASRWPGGVPPIRPKSDMISRAYLKMLEALRWSQLPISPGDVCVELGSSPGGSCLALLEQEANVIGVDPALMDKRVLAHPNFTHFRARAADLKRKEFAVAKWLFADAIITPKHTLEAIENIVTNRHVNVEAMLVTLKLLNWELAHDIDGYLDRVRSWGFRHVSVRQLAFNRREVVVFAGKSKGAIRFAKRKQKSVGNL